jgi:cysteinyl-tRNA synthetase
MKKAYIYDSLSGNKKPLTKTDVQLYVCGPTVYNHVHIGNIRPLITFDAFYRFLLKDGYKVQYLHNLTDIDDKIINRAEEENKSEHEVSEFYIKAYKQIMKSLGIKQMTMMPKVSTNIKSIIQYVDRLIKKGAGYVTPNGDVYFSIDKVKNIYGTLSKQKIDQLLNDVRKEAKGDKKNKLDFAL